MEIVHIVVDYSGDNVRIDAAFRSEGEARKFVNGKSTRLVHPTTLYEGVYEYDSLRAMAERGRVRRDALAKLTEEEKRALGLL